MERLRKVLARVDEATFQVERALLVVSLSMMTVLISLDVLQRTFSRRTGKTASFILWFMDSPTKETRALIANTVGPILFGVLSVAFVVAAMVARASLKAQREQQPTPRPGPQIIKGLLVWGALAGFIQLVLWVFPSSVPGAQKFALGFMLWSGMLGASLATRARRHIMLDAIKRKLDEKVAPAFSVMSGVVSFLFCGYLALLGFMQLHTEYIDWIENEGVGVYDALPIPEWIATAAIPITFAVMGLRFLAYGIRDAKWGPPVGGMDAHGIDLEALAKESAPDAEGAAS